MNHKPSNPSPITYNLSPVVYIHTYIHTYIHKLTLFLLFLVTFASLNTGLFFTSTLANEGISELTARALPTCFPEKVGYIGNRPFYNIFVQGDYAYVGTPLVYQSGRFVGGGLEIIDVSDKNKPMRVGYLEIGKAANVYSVYVVGDFAYVWCYVFDDPDNKPWWFCIINISDPRSPSISGTLKFSGGSSEGNKIYVVGNYAYVAAYNLLYIVDISDPKLPHLESTTYASPSLDVLDVHVIGNYAYCACLNAYAGNRRLNIYNITDPTLPQLVKSVPVSVYPHFLYVESGYAYMGGQRGTYGGISIVDVRDPENAEEVGTGWNAPTYVSDIHVIGDYAYIAGGDGMYVVEVIDRTHPVSIKHLPTCSASGIYIQGNNAYLALLDCGLKIVDISDPNNPVAVGNYRNPAGDYSYYGQLIQIAGNYAYVKDTPYGLQIIDVSDPVHPVTIYSESYNRDILTSKLRDFFVSNNMVYSYRSGEQVRIIDVSNPHSPRKRGTINKDPDAIFVAGDYAYISKREYDTRYYIFDVSNPDLPEQVGSIYGIHVNKPSYAAIYVLGDYLYGVGTYLSIVDVSNPNLPVVKGSVPLLGGGNDVHVVGNYAYVSCGSYGLRIIDVSDKDNPREVSQRIFDRPASSVHVTENRAYITTENHLEVVDVSNPSTPTPIGSYDLGANDVDVVDNLAYIIGNGAAHIINVGDCLGGPPVADFSARPISGYAPLDVQFTDRSRGNINSWQWNFGDGETSTERNPLHTFSNVGTYTVTLTVSGPDGSDAKTEIDFIQVFQNPCPVAPIACFTASPLSGLAPLGVQFLGECSLGNITSYLWTFGDGETSTEKNPFHTYQDDGSYTVSLKVSGPQGENTKTKANYINVGVCPPPVADFTCEPDSGPAPLSVHFVNNSSGDIDSCEWDFGDGTSIVTGCDALDHTFTPEGSYDVTLTVSGPCGGDFAVCTIEVGGGEECSDAAWFVTDVTIQDGTTMPADESFTKIWRLGNAGTCTWDGYQLCFVRGDQMGASPCVDVSTTSPGSTVDISVDMTAPSEVGIHKGYWRLKNSSGNWFGPEIWVEITVTLPPLTAKHVVIIDIDGLRPDVFEAELNAGNLPTFQYLMGGASYDNPGHAIVVKDTRTGFPSLTLPGHASIFTGCYVNKHGIYGNSWFDRTKGKKGAAYHYLGWLNLLTKYNLANSHLKAPTIYDAAAANKYDSIIGFNYYYDYSGRSSLIKWIEPNTLEKGYYETGETNDFDDTMVFRVLEELQKGMYKGGKWDASKFPEILTLYFAAVDHESHSDGVIIQGNNLIEIDAQLSILIHGGIKAYPLPREEGNGKAGQQRETSITFPGITNIDAPGGGGRKLVDDVVFVICADHGHSNVKDDVAHRICFDGIKKAIEDIDSCYDVERILPKNKKGERERRIEERLCVLPSNWKKITLELNDGMAHVYVRNEKSKKWGESPRLQEDVIPVAQVLKDTENTLGPYILKRNGVSMILVKDRVAKGYKVFNNGTLEGLTSNNYFNTDEAFRINNLYDDNYSGDIVILANYDDLPGSEGYYLEDTGWFTIPCSLTLMKSTHGNINLSNLKIPFIIAGKNVKSYSVPSAEQVDIAPTVADILGFWDAWKGSPKKPDGTSIFQK